MRFSECEEALDCFKGDFGQAYWANSDRFVEMNLSDESKVRIDMGGRPLDVERCPMGVLDVGRKERDEGLVYHHLLHSKSSQQP